MVRRSVFCLKSAAFSIPRTEKNPRKSPYYSELLRCVSRGMETTMIDAQKTDEVCICLQTQKTELTKRQRNYVDTFAQYRYNNFTDSAEKGA